MLEFGWSPLVLIIIIFIIHWEFSHHCLQMVFHWSLSDNNSQISRTLFNILADFSNAVFWNYSTRLRISNSSNHFINPLVTVLRAPITIDTTVIFIVQQYFQFPSKVQALIVLFAFLQEECWIMHISICLYGQTSIFCTIPCGSPCPPSRV